MCVNKQYFALTFPPPCLTAIGREEAPCGESIPALQMGDVSWTSPSALLRVRDTHALCVVLCHRQSFIFKYG